MNKLVPPIYEIDLPIPVIPVIPALIIPIDKYEPKVDSSIKFIETSI